jgi:chemotaxis protein CheD
VRPLPAGILFVHLKPGEVHLSESAAMVTTVLGSCVSLTLFDRSSRFAGICHAMLPSVAPGEGDAFRFVDAAVEYLVSRFDERGVPRGRIEAKLFGGADVLSVPGRNPAALTVGRQNVEAAREAVALARLAIAASDVGGTAGRKLHFLTHTGEVFMKKLVKAGAA